MWLDELLYGTQTTFYEGHKRAIVTILQYELFQAVKTLPRKNTPAINATRRDTVSIGLSTYSVT